MTAISATGCSWKSGLKSRQEREVPEFRRHQTAPFLTAIRHSVGHIACECGKRLEGAMSHVTVPSRGSLNVVAGLAEHLVFVIAGFVFMVLGVGLSLTVIMLPAGLVIGFIGFAMFIGGLTVRMNRS
jgi:hypothetical protein